MLTTHDQTTLMILGCLAICVLVGEQALKQMVATRHPHLLPAQLAWILLNLLAFAALIFG